MGTRQRENKWANMVKPSKKKIIILIVAVIAVTAVVAKMQSGKKVATNTGASYDQVTRGDVEVAITGSAAVEPIQRYEIISMVSGDIVESPYSVGDTVAKGDVLYKFDTSSTNLSMEKQKLSLEQSKMNYDAAMDKSKDLLVTAPCNGVISGMSVKVGQELKENVQVADINNSKVMKVVLPFNESQMSQITIGAGAYITSSTNMGGVSGSVVDKASVPTPQSDGSKLYDVTIQFNNPGAITADQVVGGKVNGMISPGSGKVEYSESGKANVAAAGTVTKIYYSNGDYVTRGTTILALSSDTVTNSIKSSEISYQNAQLALKEQEENLDDYSITSPIDGTIITKNSKAGDTIDKSNSTTVLMVVADISKLKFNLSIDELDVSKVKEGQNVKITCDALPNETFYGTISKVSVEGTATNGVTTYTAEVVIDNPGNLRPSMNVDASVIVESATDVLRIPTSDLKTAMGHSYVFVKDDSVQDKSGSSKKEATAGNSKMKSTQGTTKDGSQQSEHTYGNGSKKGSGSGFGSGQEGSSGGQTNKSSQSTNAPNASSTANTTDGKTTGNNQKQGIVPQAPEGFKTVEVTTGVAGDDFTEIVSGLSEGDIIYVETVTVSDNSAKNMMMGGGMGGGEPGGQRSGGYSGSQGQRSGGNSSSQSQKSSTTSR